MSALMTATIFDLDSSVTSQSRLLARLGDQAQTIDLRDLGPSVRYLPTREAVAKLDNAVVKAESSFVSFFGSGDFHHLTASVLKRFPQPVSVVVFDHHSDWIGLSIFPCGSWVVEALKLPNVAKIVSIGVGASGITGWRVCSGAFKDFLSGRVQIYPHDCTASRCLGRRSRHLECAEIKPRFLTSDIYWKSVAGSAWKALIRAIIDSLPTSSVYLSIDKDCLTSDYAFTNWDTGPLSIQQVIDAVRMLAETKEIVGVDICGEYSEARGENSLLEGLAARFYPKIPAPGEQDLVKNEDTNIVLLEALMALSLPVCGETPQARRGNNE